MDYERIPSPTLASRSSRIVAALSCIAARIALHRRVGGGTIIWPVEVLPVASAVALPLAFELIHVGLAQSAPPTRSSQGRLTVDKICVGSTYKPVPNLFEPVTFNQERLMTAV
eukprot:COSAG02_NODE_2459_length_8804_cov_3.707295_8_plen_113_part_00